MTDNVLAGDRPAVFDAGGDPRRLNPVLKQTARLSLVFALLLAVGLWLATRDAPGSVA